MKPEQSEILGVESKIYLIRGQKVMLDFDLADLYQVATKQLNQQVRRNPERFPADFMFSLSNQELAILKSQFVTSSFAWGGRRKPTLAFTEQGIAMLSSVLHSQRAAEVNIAIMRTFVQLRAVLFSNRELEKRITALESKYNGQFKLVFDAIREILSSRPVSTKRIVGLGRREE
ncbi:MAG: ORF6N domain-containing protein [Bdellovibrionota bacterium]